MGGDLNGEGCAWPEVPERDGVQAEPLDVLKLPGVLDAGVALVVCLGPLPRGPEAALSAIFTPSLHSALHGPQSRRS